MQEKREGSAANESLRKLPDSTTKRLLVTSTGRSGLELLDFDDWVAESQAKSGQRIGDYPAMVKAAYQNVNVGWELVRLDAKILGVREEVRKRRIVTVDGTKTEFVEAIPSIRNIWIGEGARLLTPDEATKAHYPGQKVVNLAAWSIVNGILPERFAKVGEGHFYPATKNDEVMSLRK